MEDIKNIIEKQRQFYATGKTKALDYRIEQLKLLRKQVRRYEEELIDGLSQDLGKHRTESFMTEIGLVYRHLDEMIKKLPRWGGKQRVKTPLFLWPARSYTIQAPYGNVLILSPFNYPVLLTLDPLIGAIAGGNTAIVGMSEHTPATNYVLKVLIEEAFSKEYLFFVTSSKETNTELLDNAFNKIFFTGSTRVGKIVLKKAAEHLTPVTLELGGKSPVIISKYADLEVAVERIIWGKFVNAGQTCVAPDYCLIDESVKDEFMQLLKKRLLTFYTDTPEDSRDYGRIINESSMSRLIKQLEYDQLFIFQGGHYNYAEKYIEPTILLAELSDDLLSMKEEIFGPILPILSYQELEEAILFIEQKGKPLAFYPFSSNKEELEMLLDRLDYGGATVNDTLLHLSNENLPFGGVGESGMGSYHGKKSLESFTYTKSILKRSTIFRFPIMFPPFTKEKDNTIRSFFN
ncbi:aldehyde dehydrogenase family protein [Vagococcus fluvialis]|uniref:aldehyde dehydrogenase family protein n=1 Tax=Vagococcus fluvialis TaxID=2738 RepID=UPI003B5BAC86